MHNLYPRGLLSLNLKLHIYTGYNNTLTLLSHGHKPWDAGIRPVWQSFDTRYKYDTH